MRWAGVYRGIGSFWWRSGVRRGLSRFGFLGFHLVAVVGRWVGKNLGRGFDEGLRSGLGRLGEGLFRRGLSS